MRGRGGIYGAELIGLRIISSNQGSGKVFFRYMDPPDWANGLLGMARVKANIRG